MRFASVRIGQDRVAQAILAGACQTTIGAQMKLQMSLDRFEGSQKEIAVLLADDGQQVDFPRALLPKAIKPGDVLSLEIVKDVEATQSLKDETRTLQNELKDRDLGGDVEL